MNKKVLIFTSIITLLLFSSVFALLWVRFLPFEEIVQRTITLISVITTFSVFGICALFDIGDKTYECKECGKRFEASEDILFIFQKRKKMKCKCCNKECICERI